MSGAMSNGSTSNECECVLAATTFCSSLSSLLHAPQRGKLCRRAGPFPLLSHAHAFLRTHTFLIASTKKRSIGPSSSSFSTSSSSLATLFVPLLIGPLQAFEPTRLCPPLGLASGPGPRSRSYDMEWHSLDTNTVFVLPSSVHRCRSGSNKEPGVL